MLRVQKICQRVREYDPHWTLDVLEDLRQFYIANEMEQSVQAISDASSRIENEIRKHDCLMGLEESVNVQRYNQ